MCDDAPVIIVSGSLYVDEADRDAYVQSCREVILAARATDGCLDFHLSADPIEPDRINVFEHWASAESVEAFRGSGPTAEQAVAIRSATVMQHEIAASTAL
ncbi:MAG: putative quinol monooxygenase [Acidimicrobiia bacterium]